MNYKFSCVVDNKPLFKAQAYIFITSLMEILKVAPENIFIHTTKRTDEEFYKWLEKKKVNIIEITPFSVSNPYCNKLQQLSTFQDRTDFDYVFFMDCDTAILSLEGLQLTEDVYAKPVDFPNPPSNILKNIYKEAEVVYTPFNSSLPLNNDSETEINNCNGGVYILSNKFLKKLAPKWKAYANWCVENADTFTSKYSKHADQVGFGLAMSSLGQKVTHLPLEYNYPLHVSKKILPNITPKIIHFHGCIDEHMRLIPLGLSLVDREIDTVNQCILENLNNSLDNSMFWNLRYALYPELGSGVGSRGEVLHYKQNLIKYLTYNFKSKEIIDVGCGDLELMKDFQFENYIGLDVSTESLKISKKKRPDWKFENKRIVSSDVPEADLIMCFDVLIHQSKKEDFHEMVKSMVEKAKERLIIGAYNQPPIFSSKITHFYNGILEEIKKHNKFDEIGIMGNYRDVSVVVASTNANIHKRDIGSEDLNRAFEEVERPDLLRYLVDVSRTNLGFYTSHYPRVFEYSWLLKQLEADSNKKVLDIGAGVCPLPLCLNEMGLQVTTVDSHPTIRLMQDKAQWNEWGFLDYSIINPKITSTNIDFSQYTTNERFDCIYSISVIEHMPKKIRLGVLKKAAALLTKGGSLILTIDLIPNTNNLWNLSENKEVEPIGVHGTIHTFKKELLSFGFQVEKEQIQRNIYNSRTDVYFIKSILKNKKKWLKSLLS
tara:strand:+ start:9876 stop:12020 length:2145 start_codon:yes stop_codon:yes gene_type:complete